MLFSSRRRWKLVALASTIGLLASCAASTQSTQTASPTSASGAPKVVATTTVLCNMAKEIAQDTIDLTCLLKPGVDGHVYQPVPDDRRAIERAKLILYSGYGFEPGLIKLIQSTSNSAPKVAVAEAAVAKPIVGREHSHNEPGHDEEQGEHTQTATEGGKGNDHAADEEAPDPHVWQSAENGARMVAVVQESLVKLAPANKDLYTKNAQALETELSEIHTWIKSQVATIPAPSRKLVTTHDAMTYYAEAYAIPVEGALQGISTDEKPTATRVRELVDEVKASSVPTIFAEVVVNPKLIQAVAKDANVKVADRSLYTDSLGEAGSDGDTYPKMLIANTKTIVEGLKGNYVAFR